MKNNILLEEYIKNHPPMKVGDYGVIAKMFQVSKENVRYFCKKHDIQISDNIKRSISPEDMVAVNNGKVTVEDYTNNIIEKISEKNINPYDRIKVIPIIENKDGDPEEMVLVLSDWQLGHKTRSFNLNIARERVSTLIHSVKSIVHKEQQSHKVKKLNIFLLGDFVQNEIVGAFVDLSELEAVLIDQVFEHAVPLLSVVIMELAQYFENINIYCVRGNHGKGDKMNSERTNWDDVIYNVLAIKFANNPQIVFHLTKEFYSIANIMGWKYLLAHGDQVRGGSYSIPLYSLLQRMLRWATALPEQWNTLICGHWHCFGYVDQNNQTLMVNGTLVSDDDYVRRRYGWESSTVQLLFGVHEKRPITSLYKIDFKK